MFPIIGRFGSIIIYTYTLFLFAAVLFALGLLAWRGHQESGRAIAYLDAGLVALVMGLLSGRLGHVLIHYAYFSSHLNDALAIWQGGLNWHTAMLGGLLGLWVGCRWRGLSWRGSLVSLAWALPLGVMLASAGCLMNRCAVGQEVTSLADYPLLVVMELPDLYGIVVPRFSSQGFGILLGLVTLLMIAGLSRIKIKAGIRFWLALLLSALGMFGIGYSLDDTNPMIASMHLSQVMDLGIALFAVIGGLWTALLREPDSITEPSESSI